MFRCEFSGEVSDGPVFDFITVVDPSTDRPSKVLSRVKESEKPLRVVIQSRAQSYANVYKDAEERGVKVMTEGHEIVKELLIRERHLDAVKKKYNLT